MNHSSNHSLPTWEMWIWSTSFLLESTAIILANSITCHIFWNQKRTLRQTSYVIINLALADLSVGLSAACFSVENLISSYTGKKPTEVGCLTADVFSQCASVTFLVVLSLERMHAVFWPLRHRLTATRIYIYVICVAWLFSGTMTTMFVISYIGIINQTITISVFVILTVVLPLTICVVYCRIWFRMKHTQKQSIRKHRNVTNNKLTKTLLLASILSVVTCLPMSAALLIHFICKNCLSLNNSIRAVYVGRILQYGNSLLNPVVYSVKMPEFKAKLVEFLCRHQPRSSKPLDSPISGTYLNFALKSATPILLSLTSLTSSNGRISRITDSNTNQQHEM